VATFAVEECSSEGSPGHLDFSSIDNWTKLSLW